MEQLVRHILGDIGVRGNQERALAHQSGGVGHNADKGQGKPTQHGGQSRQGHPRRNGHQHPFSAVSQSGKEPLQHRSEYLGLDAHHNKLRTAHRLAAIGRHGAAGLLRHGPGPGLVGVEQNDLLRRDSPADRPQDRAAHVSAADEGNHMIHLHNLFLFCAFFLKWELCFAHIYSNMMLIIIHVNLYNLKH